MTAYSSVLTDYLGEGTIAARPATLDIAPTALGLFFATDTGIMSAWDVATSTWINVTNAAALSSVGQGLTITSPGTVALDPLGPGLGINSGTIVAEWQGGTVSALGSGLTLTGGTLAASTVAQEWQAGTVTAITGGLAISGGTLAPQWNGGLVTAVGAGLAISGGTITATGTAGVSSIVVTSSVFLNAGTIISSGTISSPTLAAQSLIGNPTTVGAQAVAVPLGPGFSFASGTLEFSGTVASGVTAVVAGFGLTGGTITSGGTVALEASQAIRTVPFPMIGTLTGGQEMNITFTQAGTLLANGGTPQSFVGANPAATERLTINTIHSGTLITQGTVTISTAGAVTFPTFSAVAIAAGDTAQLLNQATADATFGNACLSFQYEVT